jgi:hypothetical protein
MGALPRITSAAPALRPGPCRRALAFTRRSRGITDPRLCLPGVSLMPRRLTLRLIPALLLAAAAPPAFARAPIRGADLSALASVPRAYRPALETALREFGRERVPNPACFAASYRFLGQALVVTFTPGRPLPSDRHLRGGGTSCGREVSFVIARDGRLVRRTYAR